MLAWTQRLRTEDGAYWTGATHPQGEIFPEGEQTSWTAAAVLIAYDTVIQHSSTSDFFRSLAGADLGLARTRHELPRSYDELTTAAE
jgi:hypothetical protein